MKIYISTKPPEDTSYTHVSNIMTLDRSVLDCEATDIIVDNYLSQFSEQELIEVLRKILSKVRLNGSITLIDIDVDVVALRYSRGDIDIKSLNQLLFSHSARKSFLNIESVATAFQNVFKIEQSSINSEIGTFLIKARRASDD